MRGAAVAEIQQALARPVEEIVRHRPLDVPHAVDEHAVVQHVPPFALGPIGDVLRVERPLRVDRAVLHRRPVDAVGRLERPEAGRLEIRGESDRLVLPLGRRLGILVDKRRQVVALGSLDVRQHDVVVLRATEREQPQVRPGPLDAVAAFGIGDHQGMDGVRAAVARHLPRMVVHPVLVAVLKDRDVSAAAAFPRLVERHRDLAPHRFVHLEFDLVHRVDQIVVDEQFAARANVDRVGRRRRNHRRREHQNAEQKMQSSHGGLLLECGDSSPLSLPDLRSPGRVESRLRTRFVDRSKSGDESPHSKSIPGRRSIVIRATDRIPHCHTDN